MDIQETTLNTRVQKLTEFGPIGQSVNLGVCLPKNWLISVNVPPIISAKLLCFITIYYQLFLGSNFLYKKFVIFVFITKKEKIFNFCKKFETTISNSKQRKNNKNDSTFGVKILRG